MFLTPVNNNEIINALKNLHNSNSIGTDGLLPDIIKIMQILFRDTKLTFITKHFLEEFFLGCSKMIQLSQYLKMVR